MENILDKILKLHSEYLEFDDIVKQKNDKIKDKGNTVKDLISNKSLEEIEDVLLHMYVDTLLFNKDLQLLFIKLINTIELYMELSGKDLPGDIQEFHSSMKEWVPKRVFMVEKGELVETEEGITNTARQEFLNSDFFKGIVEKVSE
jgi:hypothetical protein